MATERATATLSSDVAIGGLTRPLQALSRVDEIVERLVTAIALGEYLPGARLPSERELATSLQVGRMTVRAAIAELVARGLLDTQRGRGGGSFVRDASPASVEPHLSESIEARIESLRDISDGVSRLHGTIARAAAENRTPADCVVLQGCLDDYRVAQSGVAAQSADARLHVAIADAAHNVTLKTVLYELESRISLSAPAHLWGGAEGMRAMELRALADHERLVGAIIVGDEDAAEHVAREHNKIDIELLEAALTASRPERE